MGITFYSSGRKEGGRMWVAQACDWRVWYWNRAVVIAMTANGSFPANNRS